VGRGRKERGMRRSGKKKYDCKREKSGRKKVVKSVTKL